MVRRAPIYAAFLSFLVLAGCHSRFVEATLENHGPRPLQLLEIDYPSASFGVGALAPGAAFHYRFKVQGSGPLKLEYTDPGGNIQTAAGPELTQGQEGRLSIVIEPSGKVSWHTDLKAPD